MRDSIKNFILKTLAILLILNIILPLNILGDLELEELTDLTFEEKYRLLVDEEKKKLLEEIEKEKGKPLDELADSYLLGDYETGKIVLEKNIDELRPIASTSKILTVYIAMDYVQAGKISFDDKVKITRDSAIIGGSTYAIKPDEIYNYEDLIKAALIVSGNDATHALAQYIGGSETGFVKLMEEKLKELNVYDYYLVNATGLPDYSLEEEFNQNMLSTRSLFEISRNLIKDYPEILEYTKTDEIYEIERLYIGENTNPLLNEMPEIDGLKTGYSSRAGKCMVATGIKKTEEKHCKDMRLIGITMGSENSGQRFLALKEILQAGFEDYEYRLINEPSKSLGDIKIEDGYPSKVKLFHREEHYELVKKDEEVKYLVNRKELIAPVEKGEEIACVKYIIGNEGICDYPIYAERDIDEFTIKNVIFNTAGILKDNILYLKDSLVNIIKGA